MQEIIIGIVIILAVGLTNGVKVARIPSQFP